MVGPVAEMREKDLVKKYVGVMSLMCGTGCIAERSPGIFNMDIGKRQCGKCHEIDLQ